MKYKNLLQVLKCNVADETIEMQPLLALLKSNSFALSSINRKKYNFRALL
jgi:hypothetical protein